MREKLIEVMKDTRANAAWHKWSYEESADYLIANGVTIPVRCKDCIYRHSSEFCECRPEDGYCNDGERKDNDI